MKKIYATILFVFAFNTLLNAQTTTYDMSTSPYTTPADDTSLHTIPNWNSVHNTSATSVWKTKGTTSEIYVGSNFSPAVITAPITAAAGKTITVKTYIKFGGAADGFDAANAAKSILLIALKSGNQSLKSPFTAGSGVDFVNRDGVFVQSNTTATLTLTNVEDGAGLGGFDTNPSVVSAINTYYEITLTYKIGASSALSTKSCQIKNMTSGLTSAVGTRSGLEPGLYSAITGVGAYYFIWSQTFYVASPGLTKMSVNKISIDVATTPLSTKNFNTFKFSTYPNPVKDVLNISTTENIQKISVIDMLGRTVLTPQTGSEINLSSLTKGSYFLSLESENGVSTKKIIKE